MLIDDEPFDLKMLARQLANLGLKDVTCHECANHALAALESNCFAFEMVFCDLQMPEIDGIELVRHLVRIGYDGSLVLISGEDERILKSAKELARAHKLRVLGALQKPVAPEQLRNIFDSHIQPPAPGPRSARKSYSVDELRRAIKGGELVNFYQPKVQLASGAIAGVETLVRWRHPQDGLVFPDQFIATAEEHGLINDLTRTVLVGALHQARRWMDEGLVLSIAVNVSMEDLGSLEFPDWIAQAASSADVPLVRLVLEVTESRLMKNPLEVIDILTRLRLKRFGLSIDDFGTGYSSLAQLRDIPFDELKVDQGFVHGAYRDASLKAILDASLAMAKQLGMKTVVEGVEDQADWNFLRTCACDLAQGYFIAKPMPPTDLTHWIDRWQMRYQEICGNGS